MLLSKFFAPVLKENPKDATIVSHILMLKAALVRQSASGIYVWLPLGVKVLDKVSNIIKQEINKTGALNVLMSTIQSSDLWLESGRYQDYGAEMLKIKDRHGRDLLYSPTNEEQLTQLFRDNIKSYKDLPLNLYQINWKFRDEIRPRFGVMRGREFLMKDGYSFDLTKEDAEISYKKMFAAYLSLFNKMELKAIPMKADTGPIGGNLSHEFIILADTGESGVFCDKDLLNIKLLEKEIDYNQDIDNIFNTFTSYYAATDEMHEDSNEEYQKVKDRVIEKRGIEVGHIFYFADKYSKSMKASVLNKEGKNTDVLMGSYGIGVSRLVGAIIEANHDEKGIIWPKSVAPFDVIISSLGSSSEIHKACFDIYQQLQNKNYDVLFNDKDDSVGQKLNTADLLGIPFQINIGKKSLENNTLEFKIRKTGEIIPLKIDDMTTIYGMLQSK